jgi:hypothetical protein
MNSLAMIPLKTIIFIGFGVSLFIMVYLMTVSNKITSKDYFLIVISCWEYSWVDCSRVYRPSNIIISRDSILLSLFLRMEISLYARYCIMSVKGTVRPDWIYMRVVPWIGLEKNINRYMFLIFEFNFLIFEKTSKFWAASCKIESNLLLVRITV